MIVVWLTIVVFAVVGFFWVVWRTRGFEEGFFKAGKQPQRAVDEPLQRVADNIRKMGLYELRALYIQVQALYLQQLQVTSAGSSTDEYLRQLQDQQDQRDQLIPIAERQRDQLATALMILADKPNLQDALRELQTAREKKRRFELVEEIQLNKVWNELMKLPESDSTGLGTRQTREGG